MSHNTIRKTIRAFEKAEDDQIRDNVQKRIISNDPDRRPNRPKIPLSAVMSAFQKEVIQLMYPEFEIIFHDTQNLPHGFAASLRKMESQLIMRFKIRRNSKVIDVGGSRLSMVVSGFDNVHACCPLLDLRDQDRHERQMQDIAALDDQERLIKKHPATRMIIDEAKNYLMNAALAVGNRRPHVGRYFCNLTAQECTAPGDAAMSIHSAYDIPFEEWPTIMESHGVSEAWLTMIFDPRIFFLPEGFIDVLGCRYRVDLERDTISFAFKNDPSNGYTHCFSNYKKYFSCQPLEKNGVYYYLEMCENRAGVQFIRIARATNRVYRDNFLSLSLSCDDFADTMILHTFAFSGWEYYNPKNALLPKKMIIPRNLYERTCEYIYGLEMAKVTMTVVVSYLKSRNNRVLVNGKDFDVPERIPSEDLIDLAVSLIVCCGAKMADAHRTLELGNIVEKDIRNNKRSGFLSRFVRSCVMTFKNMMDVVSEAASFANLVSYFSGEEDHLVNAEFIPRFLDFESSFREMINSTPYLPPVYVGGTNTPSEDDFRGEEDPLLAISRIGHPEDSSDDSASIHSDSIFGSSDSDSVPSEKPEDKTPQEQETSQTPETKPSTPVEKESDQHSEDPSVPDSTNDATETFSYDAELLEYHDYLCAEHKNIKAECARMYGSIVSADGTIHEIPLIAVQKTAKEVDILVKSGTVYKSHKGFAKGEYIYAFDGKSFVEIDYVGETNVYTTNQTTSQYLLVSENLRLCQSEKLASAISGAFSLNSRAEMRLIEGVPGCGKTTELIKVAQPGDLILTVCRATKDEIVERVMALRCDGDPEKLAEFSIRTVDSYLLNCRRKFSTVYLDEALMVHAGSIVAIARYSQATKIVMYGDRNQIGFVSRVPNMVLKYRNFDFSSFVIETRNMSYRCPADVASLFFKSYTDGFYTKNEKTLSMTVNKISTLSAVPKDIGKKYITLKQAEKYEMMKAGYVNVNTVHEVQGQTFKNVIYVRLAQKNEINHSVKDYALVALTRHTNTCAYYTVDASDMTSQMIRGVKMNSNVNGIPKEETKKKVEEVPKPARKTNNKPITSTNVTAKSKTSTDNVDMSPEALEKRAKKHISRTLLSRQKLNIKTRQLGNTTKIGAHLAINGMLKEKVQPTVEYKDLVDIPKILCENKSYRCEYKETNKMLRTSMHSGQLKLLVSELQFFMSQGILKKEEATKTVIYIGSSPGTHLLFLASLVPHVRFILFDSRRMDRRLDHLSNVEFHQTNVDASTVEETIRCLGLANRVSEEQQLFLISDLRSEGSETNLTKSNDVIYDDNALNRSLVLAFKPDAALLKFRLPYDKQYTDYFDGEIIFGVCARQTSTETRLLVTEWASKRRYDHSDYERMCCYYNTNIRRCSVENASHCLVDTCYDCVMVGKVFSDLIEFFVGTGNRFSLRTLVHWTVTESMLALIRQMYYDDHAHARRSLKLLEVQSASARQRNYRLQNALTRLTESLFGPSLARPMILSAHQVGGECNKIGEFLMNMFSVLRRNCFISAFSVCATTLNGFRNGFRTTFHLPVSITKVLVAILQQSVDETISHTWCNRDSIVAAKNSYTRTISRWVNSTWMKMEPQIMKVPFVGGYCGLPLRITRKTLRLLTSPWTDYGCDYEYSEEAIANNTRFSVEDLPDKVKDKIQRIAEANDATMHPRRTYSTVPKVIDEKITDIKFEFDTNYESPVVVSSLQSFYDECLPGASYACDEFDEYEFEYNDIDLRLEATKFDYSRSFNHVPTDGINAKNSEYLRSRLRTSQPHDRPKTQRQILVAMGKRNCEVPIFVMPCDLQELCDTTFKSFVDSYCVPDAWAKLKRYSKDPLSIDKDALLEWAATHENIKLSRLTNEEVPLETTEMYEYNLNIKSVAKNTLTPASCNEYPALQTIVHHDSRVNVVFSSIFRQLCDRLNSLIKPNVHMPFRKSVRQLEDHLNRFLESEMDYDTLEVDMSKYDKSQVDNTYAFEIFLYKSLGLDALLAEHWNSSHRITLVKNILCGITAMIAWQRKTGDATTLLGNTVVGAAALAYAEPNVQHAKAMYFMGDDSLFFFTKKDMIRHPVNKSAIVERMAGCFNLEAKVMNYRDSYYFASYFIVRGTDFFRVIPDPLKRVERLGKTVPNDLSLLIQRYISFKDLVGSYADVTVQDNLKSSFYQRYNCGIELECAMLELHKLSCRLTNYAALFGFEVHLSKEEEIELIDSVLSTDQRNCVSSVIFCNGTV